MQYVIIFDTENNIKIMEANLITLKELRKICDGWIGLTPIFIGEETGFKFAFDEDTMYKNHPVPTMKLYPTQNTYVTSELCGTIVLVKEQGEDLVGLNMNELYKFIHEYKGLNIDIKENLLRAYDNLLGTYKKLEGDEYYSLTLWKDYPVIDIKYSHDFEEIKKEYDRIKESLDENEHLELSVMIYNEDERKIEENLYSIILNSTTI